MALPKPALPDTLSAHVMWWRFARAIPRLSEHLADLADRLENASRAALDLSFALDMAPYRRRDARGKAKDGEVPALRNNLRKAIANVTRWFGHHHKFRHMLQEARLALSRGEPYPLVPSVAAQDPETFKAACLPAVADPDAFRAIAVHLRRFGEHCRCRALESKQGHRPKDEGLREIKDWWRERGGTLPALARELIAEGAIVDVKEGKLLERLKKL